MNNSLSEQVRASVAAGQKRLVKGWKALPAHEEVRVVVGLLAFLEVVLVLAMNVCVRGG